MTTVVIGATMWLLISLALILNAVGAPRRLTQVPLALLCLQFVTVVVAFSREECAGGPCAGAQGLHGPSQTAVEYVLPALAAAFTAYAIGYGLRHHRRINAPSTRR